MPAFGNPAMPAVSSDLLPPRWLGGHRAYWLCQLSGWSCLLALTFVTFATNTRTTRPIVYFSVVAMFFTAAIASHVLRALLRRLRDRTAGVQLFLGVVAILAVLAGLMGAAFHTASLAWLEAGDRPPLVWLAMQYGFLFTGWSAVYLAVGFYRKHRAATVLQLRLESSRREAELRALKARINPHFLFNSLNTLRALIPRELAKPRSAVTMLADLLRASLSMEQHDLVPLARELETVDNYLALEQLRLESRLRVARQISPAALASPVPPFLVQSLVENAVKHGIAPREDGGEITIEASVHEGTLLLRVTNPGRLGQIEGSPGVGLESARARLTHLFGPTARLSLHQTGPNLVAAELTLSAPPFNAPKS